MYQNECGKDSEIITKINAESTVGKFFKWFAASLTVSPFSLSSSFCLTNFALVKLLIYFFVFHCLQVLDPEKANFV